MNTNLETFKTELKAQIVASMKSGDTVRTLTLRSISNAITIKEKDASGKDVIVVDLLSSMAKTRKQSIEAYESAGNVELANQEKLELDIIEEFLPKMLSDDQIKCLISDMIAELGYKPTIKDMGTLMSKFKSEFPGQDASKVSAIIKSKIV